MKRKIGEIYNKPIVIGDKNLVTRNEIHESELNASTGGGDAPSQPNGGINMKYIDIRAMDELDAAQIAMFAYCVAGLTEDNTFVAITLPFEMLMPIDTNKRFAISIPWDAYVYMQGTKMLVGPTIEAQFGSKLKYLTEEEFYNPATYA